MRRFSALCLALLATAAVHTPAAADPREISVVPESELRFGSFAVMGAGARSVAANGTVTDSFILPTQAGDTGPARFTVSYDRGNASRRSLDIEVELVLAPIGPVTQGGVTAQIGAFESTLPNHPTIVPGQAIRISMPNCVTRVCARSFAIGGRIDVTRNFGGADLSIPLVFDATVVSLR